MRRFRFAALGLSLGLAAVAGAAAAADGPPPIRFEEVGAAAGLAFTHTQRSFGTRPKAQVLEMFTDGGAAVAVGDYDGDGHDDLFFTDSGEGKPNHLLRNLFGETGEIAFADVAAAAGVAGGNDAGSIVADALWLDFDDDGRLDLLVSRFGTPRLYRNLGPQGTEGKIRFAEVSEAAGLTKLGNTIAAVAFDSDGDGWLDLLFANYFQPVNLLELEDPHVLPEDLDNAHNGGGVTLWRNVAGGNPATGGRAFVEVTAAAGLAHHTGWSLDLGHGDLDNDGDQDVYVACDYGTDRLFLNRGDGTFEDATERLLGLDTKKGMNVAMADYDHNGWLDVYVTNITDEYMRECNMLWHNAGADGFIDVGAESGTCDSDWGWAAQFADLDNDGWDDLFVVDGLRSAGEENYIPVLLEMILTPGIDFSDLRSYPDIGSRSWSGYQPQRLFRNLGDGTFREMAAEAGLDNLLDGRGIGVADFDDDGRLDLVQTNARERPRLHHNVSPAAGSWVELRLRGAGVAGGGSNRGAVGARVTVTTRDGRRLLGQIDGGNGYAGQVSTRLHFGLGHEGWGEGSSAARVEIHWPSGRREVLEARGGTPPLPLGRISVVEEGRGVVRPAAAELKPGETRRRELLFQHRNLGKALYENPATQYEAIDELRRALELAPDSVRERVNLGLALLRAGQTEEGIAELERAQKQDPSIPHTWFNLGIAYKQASRYPEAIRQLEGMLERVSDEPITHYNLGVLYKIEGEPERALAHFERAAELDPNLAGPHFQLAAAYRLAGRGEDAARETARFRDLKARDAGAAVPEDLEWSWYSELVETIEPTPRPAPPAKPAFAGHPLAEGVDPGSAGLVVLEADGEPEPDLLVWSAAGMRFFPGGRAPAGSAAPDGLTGLAGVRHVAAGDLDGDGLADLAVVGARGARVLVSRGGRFEPLPAALPETAGRAFDLAVWLDQDHDYDPDLLLLGPQPALLRNNGDGTFTDRTERFPFVAPELQAGSPHSTIELAGGGRRGTAAGGAQTLRAPFGGWVALRPRGTPPALGPTQVSAAQPPEPRQLGVAAVAVFDLVADSQGFDVAVVSTDGTGTLYRDRLGGRYEARPLPELPAGARALVAADADHDGWTDLIAAGGGGVTLLRNDHREGFETVAVASAASGAGAPLAMLDLDNRGAGDLVAAGRLLADRGQGRFESEGPLDAALDATLDTVLDGAVAVAAADFDADGKTDLAAVTAAGAVAVLTNRTETAHGFLRLALEGVKNPKLAAGAEIEVKAGTLYQKKLYRGVPLVFGLGGAKEADAVRITWPNGLIQNEIHQLAGTSVRYREAPRLSGSCPMVFTWDGDGFRFITDVLGVAPLGASSGDGEYFPVDHDEVIQIPGDALAPRPDGTYEVRITEELREVAYLDQVRLLAVDHPADTEILTNVKFQGPPFPELRLYGARRKRRPVTARDHRGHDVLPPLLARDATYPDGFARDAAGLAELHHLDLGFSEPIAPDGRALLVLTGWVDWADGSTFLAASQSDGPGLVLPYLQARDARGRWVTVIEDLGLPAGKPKTLVADLTGKLPAGARELRIVTSACVYWDEIYVADDPGPPPLDLTEVPAVAARLHFRGFSRPVLHPERKQPERFVYADRRPLTMWNPTPGLYTRYGEVGELAREVDDRLVVMGSGDELKLRFDASALPPPPEGWQRDFLLWVDGWAKDADANTAHSQTVEPLPYHGMPRYPYEAPDHFPDDAAHRLYRERYLTRPALVPIQPLRPTEARPSAGAMRP